MVAVEDLMSTEDAIAYLGISRAGFYNLARRVEIRRYRIPGQGKRTFFHREDIQKRRVPVAYTGKGVAA